MDLLDWHRGSLSSRRLAVLVKHLPRDSAVNRDLHGEAVEWDANTHLLAAITDHLAVANWITISMNSDEEAEPLPYPEPVPRPGLEESAPGATGLPDEEQQPSPALPDPDQLARFFN
ncbi:hypothetical protein [Streptomyces caatingaensis]|uniref:Uncharacterized protein n=1 Tax=Streptomyces caatingaensis TaxID=1678637 RepID=A0A0K9XAH3_9ACTN|nr:hypothetical protein [Streptomyces caatingaensis]KNB50106.1 hypothetical protein AC230_25740 [Streptomyces caatingaensis]